MSELQLYLLAAGAVLIIAVVAYNVWQERRARAKAERTFGEGPGDALFDAPAVERREPTLGAMPDPPARTAEATPAAQRVAPEELEAPGGPASEISNRVDTVAVILADDPIMAEQLDPLMAALRAHRTPVHVEGIVDEQWHPVDASTRRSWRELRVGLQLANRGGPVAEEEIERFNRAIADFAASVGAVSQRESPQAAATRARELDRICAEADIEVAVNVVGQFGATFPVARVKALALEHGISETASGDLVSYASDGGPEFVVRRFEDPQSRAAANVYPGLTFALDVPNVVDPVGTLLDMVRVATAFAERLSGQLVDDNRKPLTEQGVAALRRSLERIVQQMQSHGIPAGSALARRLFA